MKTYKSIVTITWKFESDKPEEECMRQAKAQLGTILDCEPFGDEFDGFSIQVDIAPMKDRKKLQHIAVYSFDEIMPHITVEDTKKEFVVNGISYMVRMNSDRYHVFKESRFCVSCGLEGVKMVLDINPGDQSPHFNLYGEENGRMVLMTKDHKIAKSKGGPNARDNYESMCAICNNLKGAYDLNALQVKELRRIYKNEDKLPRKELKTLINTTRDEMTGSSTDQ